jgi:magnesium transporter
LLRYYRLDSERLIPLSPGASGSLPPDASWIDLVEPTDAEERFLEKALGLDVPTRDEASELQTSSRLRVQGGTLYMSAILPYGQEREPLQTLPVTFVRTGGLLLTVRYGRPEAVDHFVQRAGAGEWQLRHVDDVLAALLDVIVDRIADRLEFIGSDLKMIERAIFHREQERSSRRPLSIGKRIHALQGAVEQIGIHHMTSFGLRDCLQSLQRLLVFCRAHHGDADDARKFHTIEEDLRAIADYDSDLNNSMDFMVNATVGLIDVQQNKVIYALSIAGIVLTPPVLVASIYGMNFGHMPELHWPWGYGWALTLMAVSASVPWLLFKLKHWL